MIAIDLCAYLTRYGVEWAPLSSQAAAEAERTWRDIFGASFGKHRRMRQGAKAEFAYQQETCTRYLIIPFTANVAGLPIHVLRRAPEGYDCRGPLVPLGAFHAVEFFVASIDYAWTMVHTHEDQAFGGPFFLTAEWT